VQLLKVFEIVPGFLDWWSIIENEKHSIPKGRKTKVLDLVDRWKEVKPGLNDYFAQS
jgi:hypothetical protein